MSTKRLSLTEPTKKLELPMPYKKESPKKESPIVNVDLEGLKVGLDNLPYVDKLFLVWISSVQQQCVQAEFKESMICQRMADFFPDLSGVGSYLSGETKSLNIGTDLTPQTFELYYTLLKRTRLYRLFVLSVSGVLAAGVGAKYALRKWTNYIETRKSTPQQEKTEKSILRTKDVKSAERLISSPKSNPKPKSKSKHKSKHKSKK
jgi:hypothetical protein